MKGQAFHSFCIPLQEQRRKYQRMAHFHETSSLLLFLLSFFCFLFLSSSSFSTDEGNNQLSSLLTPQELADAAGYGEEKLSSVLVTGTVLCGHCPGQEWPVPGALVGVTCKTGGRKRKLNWAKATTDEYGDFIVDLPSHLHALPKLDKACMVRVLRLPKRSHCRRVLAGKLRGIRVSSVGNGIRTYTTGSIRLLSQFGPRRMCLKNMGYSEEERTWR